MLKRSLLLSSLKYLWVGCAELVLGCVVLPEEAQREHQPGPMRKYAKWLGHWKPEYDAIRSENELVLLVRVVSHLASHHYNQ